MKHKICLFLLIFCATLALGNFRAAVAYDTPCERFGDADVVFVGRYVEQGYDVNTLEDPKLYFEVVEPFLGTVEKSRLLINVGDSIYSLDYKIDELYLIYADELNGELGARWDNKAVSDAGEDLSFLRNLSASDGLGMRVFGDVSEDVSAVANEALKRKIISGVKIRFEKIGAKNVFFETATDFDGNYEIILPPGNYNVEPVLSAPVYRNISVILHRLPRVNAKDGGCLEHSFWLRNNVSVGGKLLYADGTPVEDAFITILAQEGEINSDSTETAKTDKSGKFKFENIPVGRYFLVLNYFDEEDYEADELDKALNGRIFPRFFYPTTTEKSKAKLIEIDLGQTPKPFEFRLPARFTPKKIYGNLFWDDGSPADSASVELKSTDKTSEFKGSWNKTEEGGKFILKGFAKGEYFIRARDSQKIGEEFVEFCAESEKFKIDKVSSGFKLVLKRGECLE
jgi:hypothetical protein